LDSANRSLKICGLIVISTKQATSNSHFELAGI
jgi:hypothetical protein